MWCVWIKASLGAGGESIIAFVPSFEWIDLRISVYQCVHICINLQQLEEYQDSLIPTFGEMVSSRDRFSENGTVYSIILAASP